MSAIDGVSKPPIYGLERSHPESMMVKISWTSACARSETFAFKSGLTLLPKSFATDRVLVWCQCMYESIVAFFSELGDAYKFGSCPFLLPYRSHKYAMIAGLSVRAISPSTSTGTFVERMHVRFWKFSCFVPILLDAPGTAISISKGTPSCNIVHAQEVNGWLKGTPNNLIEAFFPDIVQIYSFANELWHDF